VKIEFYIEIRFYSKHQRQQRKPPNTINTSQSQRERHRGWASGYLCFLQAFTTFSAGVCEKLSIKRGHHLPPRCHTHTHTHTDPCTSGLPQANTSDPSISSRQPMGTASTPRAKGDRLNKEDGARVSSTMGAHFSPGLLENCCVNVSLSTLPRGQPLEDHLQDYSLPSEVTRSFRLHSARLYAPIHTNQCSLQPK